MDNPSSYSVFKAALTNQGLAQPRGGYMGPN